MDRRVLSSVNVGRYHLVRPVGSGSAGTVYEAVDSALGRRVAVKVLHAPLVDGAPNKRAIDRFLREGRAAAQVRHPHVVTVYDAGIDDGSPFLVMELVEGETLAQRLRRERRLAQSRAVELLLPLAGAVAELHAAGVLHRDLKPANILLSRGQEVDPKIADFGVSRVDDGSVSLTRPGAIVGTPEYMAPEVLCAAESATERSDQYALAVVLYECVTGERPFRGETTVDVMRAVARADPPAPSSRVPSLSKAFDAAVLRAMNADPQQRFESVDDFAAALLPFASEGVAARWRAEFAPDDKTSSEGDGVVRALVRPAVSPTIAAPWSRRSAALAVLGAAVVAPALAIGFGRAGSSDPGVGAREVATAGGTSAWSGPSVIERRAPVEIAPSSVASTGIVEGTPVAAPPSETVALAPATGGRSPPRAPKPSSLAKVTSTPASSIGPIPSSRVAAVSVPAPSSEPPPRSKPAAPTGDNGAPILDVP